MQKASTHTAWEIKETAHKLCLTTKNAQKTCVETDDGRTDMKPNVLAPTPGLVAGPAHENISVDSHDKEALARVQKFSEISPKFRREDERKF